MGFSNREFGAKYPPENPNYNSMHSSRSGRDVEGSRHTSGNHSSRYHHQEYVNQGMVRDSSDERRRPDHIDNDYRNDQMYGQSWEPEEESRVASRTASEIYAETRFPQPDYGHYDYDKDARSDIVSVKTKTTRDGRIVMETMTAPHPCCPNTKSVCCLMILLNLALLLICLGFIVVLQLSEPAYVWYVGIAMLIVGFCVLFGSMIYCIVVCRETEHLRAPPGELYWTNHWSKSVNLPELHYSNTQYKPTDYKGSEFSFRTEPSRTTTATTHTRY